MSVTVVVLIIAVTNFHAHGQSMGISSSAITPHSSSILELRSTNKGILIPRMTQAQRDAINSGTFATGLFCL